MGCGCCALRSGGGGGLIFVGDDDDVLARADDGILFAQCGLLAVGGLEKREFGGEVSLLVFELCGLRVRYLAGLCGLDAFARDGDDGEAHKDDEEYDKERHAAGKENAFENSSSFEICHCVVSYFCYLIISRRNKNSTDMSIFSKKHKRKVGIAWGIVSVLIIVMMIALYMPVLFSR